MRRNGLWRETLIAYLSYKAKQARILSFTGSERGTSSRCPRCGHKHTPTFCSWACRACGFVAHRDLVGSINMHQLAYGHQVEFPRSFTIVDQDQSDNVTTTYLVTASGQIAQNTAANVAALGSQVQANGSDERLLTLVDAAIGCTPWMAPDLANPGHMVTALPLNELQAEIWQNAPVALVPNADPMTQTNNHPDLAKLNAYRIGVDQVPSPDAQASSTRTFCQHLLGIAPNWLLLDEPLTGHAPPADPAVANSLFTFLVQRFVMTFEANGLGCLKRLHQPDLVTNLRR